MIDLNQSNSQEMLRKNLEEKIVREKKGKPGPKFCDKKSRANNQTELSKWNELRPYFLNAR